MGGRGGLGGRFQAALFSWGLVESFSRFSYRCALLNTPQPCTLACMQANNNPTEPTTHQPQGEGPACSLCGLDFYAPVHDLPSAFLDGLEDEGSTSRLAELQARAAATARRKAQAEAARQAEAYEKVKVMGWKAP